MCNPLSTVRCPKREDALRRKMIYLVSFVLALGLAGKGWPYASNPSPANNSFHADTRVSLSWSKGPHAISYDVYFGTNFDDVKLGTGGTFQGNQTEMLFIVGIPGFIYPDGLVPGTTYYWRIDEVNILHPDSPWKGDVWSFTVPPKTACNPVPADGATYVDTNVTLSWTPGFGAFIHTVYFGDNFNDVYNASGGLPHSTTPLFTPGPLELGKTYYWRVDEFDSLTTHKGDVWMFTTFSEIPVFEDPSLVIYYSFDDIRNIVVDQSGKSHDGVVQGNVTAEPNGKHAGAARFATGSYLDLDGPGFPAEDIPTSGITLTAWVKCENTGENHAIFNARASDETWLIHPELLSSGQYRWLLRGYGGFTIFDIRAGSVTWDEWLHFAGTYDKASKKAILYINGEVVEEENVTTARNIASDWASGARVGYNIDNAMPFTGLMDDFFLFKVALPQVEIKKIMQGIRYPFSFSPEPANGAIHADMWASLSWIPGSTAISHDIYLGDNFDDVNNGVGGTFQGNQTTTTFTIGLPGGPYPDGLVLDTTYYWRIDEVEADGSTVHKGDVWSFTVADPLAEALGTALHFFTRGDADWFSQSRIWYHDSYSAQSGDITDEQESWLQTMVNGAGTVSFFWKVSSEGNYDCLEFYIDGTLQDQISGSEDWHNMTYEITGSGLHTLEWRYFKDSSMGRGDDCGWVDKVEWVTN